MSDATAADATTIDADQLAELLRADPRAAAARLLEAAKRGDIEAQAIYAQMLSEGRGVPCDAIEALHWYTLAANCRHAGAMNMVGRCHELGHGTVANGELAAAWYRRAAECGSLWGMYNYANLLATGRGVRADVARAFRWYLRAAERGHAKSMNLVGRCYEEGLGVEIDIAVAHRWYEKSAEAGDFRGQRSLAAVLLEAGRADEAAYWLRRAVEAKAAAYR